MSSFDYLSRSTLRRLADMGTMGVGDHSDAFLYKRVNKKKEKGGLFSAKNT